MSARLMENMAEGPPEINEESISELCRILKHLEKQMSREELQRLLATDQSWERLMTNYNLDRNEVNVLFTAIFDVKREISGILEELDRWKITAKEQIVKFNDAADCIDQTHKYCTIAKGVATATSVISVGLSAYTRGNGMLTAIKTGLEASAAIASCISDVFDEARCSIAKKQAIMKDNINHELILEEVKQALTNQMFQIGSIFQPMERFIKSVMAISKAIADPRRISNAQQHSTMGNAAQTGARQKRRVQKASRRTAQATSKEVLVEKGFNKVEILRNFITAFQKFQHVSQGARAKTVRELREMASQLSQRLEDVGDICETLRWVQSLKSLIPTGNWASETPWIYQVGRTKTDIIFEIASSMLRGAFLKILSILGLGKRI
ncbi:uncharacterized protein LOC103164693 [Ornithorhynchus anatinus]|uniref:Uncharacterized protein n=1 Tax=Ornithorhynchus anatinus TaxID=9258 RepID=A0A6I8N1D6_ORNAN|nr:uncharacterized protein LOC103164693 [Ornithorhynchus anatinus]